MLPINRKISAYNYTAGNNIQYIVVHDVGTMSPAVNNANFFAGGDRGASAHYFVDDISVWQSVEDYNGAHHVGDGENQYGINNGNSIGVEMCLPGGIVTAVTEQNTVELVKYLMQKYNVPINRVVRHYDASRKNCPAQFNLDGKWTRWYAFKDKLIANVKNGWEKSGNDWYYYFDGQLAQNGWRNIDGKWYLFDAHSKMLTGWQAKDNKWYYFTEDGQMHTGWSLIDGKWYYFDQDGIMTEGWKKIDGKWYYMEKSGAMRQGWLKDKSNLWYYLSIPNGDMAVGVKSIDGKKYIFSGEGVCTNP